MNVRYGCCAAILDTFLGSEVGCTKLQQRGTVDNQKYNPLLTHSTGKTILQEAGPYLDAAAQADSVSLRSLAAEQYGQTLALQQQLQPRFAAMEIDTAAVTAPAASSGTLVKLLALLGVSHSPAVEI